MPNEDISNVASVLTEFNNKVSDIETRHELLRERVLSLGNTFIKNRDELRREINLVKDDIRSIKELLEKVQEILRHTLLELENCARKEDLQMFEKYIKLWEPLKFVKTDEVKEIVENYLENIKIGVKPGESKEE